MTVALAVSEEGTEASGPPSLLILHGLFGSARNWATLAKRLGATRHVLALDLRNHGGSAWAPSMSYAEMAEDVKTVIEERRLGRVALVGHSMGGKVAMTLALQDGVLIERLAVVDVAPVIYPPHFRALVAAMRSVDLTGETRRSRVEEALRPQIPDQATRLFLMQNLVLEDGQLRWRLNLAAIERALPEISGFAAPAGRPYPGPTLFIGGGRSSYIRPQHEGAIRRLFPRAVVAAIPDAGHLVHAEQPDAFLELLLPFLDGP